MDSTKRLIAAGCYFSVLFAPFLFPVVVYFALPNAELKQHAKRALLSHLIPYGSIVIAIIVWVTADTPEHLAAGTLLIGLGALLASGIVVVWNLIKGVQLLVK